MNAIMLQTYWRTGEYIVEYEQNGADRAVYGDGLMRRLARDLTLRLGCGFAHSNLNYMRKFHLMSQKIQTSGFSKKGQTSDFFDVEPLSGNSARRRSARNSVLYCRLRRGCRQVHVCGGMILNRRVNHEEAFE